MSRSRPPTPAPGTFEPAPPADSGEVLRLYAIAARAACARPESLGVVGDALRAAASRLSPPAALAAAECDRLWRAFAAVARRLASDRWARAGQALLADLDALGQRLEVMPLPSWSDLPQALRASLPPSVQDDELDLAPAAREALDELSRLSPDERAARLARLVAAGDLTRGEAAMLSQLTVAPQAVDASGEALADVLRRVAGAARRPSG